MPLCTSLFLMALALSPPTRAAPDDPEIPRLVHQLGSDNFAQRQEATKKLQAIGEPARAALRDASNSPDPEIQRRAATLLQEMNAKLLVFSHKLHTHEIHGIALTADGSRVISASSDGTIRIVEVKTGKPLHCLEHPAAYTVALSADGKKMISTASSGKPSLRLWDLQTGQELSRLPGYAATAYRVALSPDAKHVLLDCYPEQVVRLIDIESGDQVHRFQGHTQSIQAVALSADGKFSLSGGHDGTLRLWDNATGKEMRRIDGHSDRIWSVALMSDGKRAASGGQERTIKLWDLQTGNLIRQMMTHADGTHGLAFSRDGLLASASYGHTLSLWDVDTGIELHRYEDATDKLYEVAFSADGKVLAAAGRDKIVRVWRVPSVSRKEPRTK